MPVALTQQRKRCAFDLAPDTVEALEEQSPVGGLLPHACHVQGVVF
jgi:hypothetical protein